MVKKIFIVISFIILFFNNSSFVFSQSPTSSPPTTTSAPAGDIDQPDDMSIWEQIFYSIVSWFKSLFGINDYYSKDYDPSTQNDSQLNTDYTSDKKDTTTRVLPEATRKFHKGVYLNDVITGKNGYKNNSVKSDSASCPDIKPSDVVYYFYTKGEKVLYKLDDPQNPIDYDKNLIERFKIDLVSDESCYLNFYNNHENVPQGDFHDQPGMAAPASTQLNNSIRNVMPVSDQGEDAPKDNYSTDNAEKLVKDSDKQEGNMLFGFIPNDGHDQITCGTNDADTRENLRQSFAHWLTPNSWHNAADDDGIEAPPSRANDDGSNGSNCAQSGHGRGMSQYGAYGMALSGYNYQQILTSYYGDSSMGVTFSKISSTNDKITVALTETEKNNPCQELVTKYPGRFKIISNNYCTNSNKICSSINNSAHNTLCYNTITLSIDDYLKGLGEIPASWSVEAHKAQSVAARTYAYSRTNKLSKAIKNCSYDQVFRCKKLLNNLVSNTNQTIGSDTTSNEVLLKNGKIFSTEYSSCHGKASLTPPYFDGTAFERLAKAPVLSSNGICPSVITGTGPSGGVVNGLYVFEGAVHGGRFKERYDIGNVDGGKYLTTYSGSCQLDNRVFPALDLLIAAANSEVPGNKIGLSSCYRSVARQSALWQRALAKYGSESIARKWVAPPGRSPHHTGRAIDFKDNHGTLDRSSTIYLWLVNNASRFGWYNYQLEPWHWEYNP